MSEALRLGTSLLNAPQHIQVINSEIFRDQVVLNLNESATRNVSGTFREELHNGISPDIYSRGGYTSAQRNGVDMRSLGKGPIADDLAIIDFTITDPSIHPFVGNGHNAFLTVQHRFKFDWQLTTKLVYIRSRYNGTLFWVKKLAMRLKNFRIEALAC